MAEIPEYNIRRDHIIAIVGKRAGGKSTLIRWIVRESDFKGTEIIDGNPRGEDYDLKRDFPDCENVKIVPRKFTDVAWDTFDNEDNFKDKFVVIDECDLIAYYHRDFHRQFVNTGRHVNSGGIMAARRPTMLPRDLTANADWTFIFRSKERTVQDFIRASYNEHVAEIAANLGKYEFVAVDASQDPVFRAKLTPDGRRMEILEQYPDTWSSTSGSEPHNPPSESAPNSGDRVSREAPSGETRRNRRKTSAR
jgi:hypothetical protein